MTRRRGIVVFTDGEGCGGIVYVRRRQGLVHGIGQPLHLGGTVGPVLDEGLAGDALAVLQRFGSLELHQGAGAVWHVALDAGPQHADALAHEVAVA